jgi:DNA polymerase-1
MLALDTETFLFGPGRLAPRIVCATFAEAGEDPWGVGNGDPGAKAFVGASLSLEFGGVNIAYDLACICAMWPDLVTPVFQALEDDRVHDAIIREKLYNLATHGEIDHVAGMRVDYSLAGMAYKRLGVKVEGKEGEDVWRLRYAELDGKPFAEYPAEAARYALADAQITHELLVEQQKRIRPEILATEALHVRAAFCAYLQSCWGIRVDPERKRALEARVDAELSDLPLLYSSGLVTPAQPPRPYKRSPGKFAVAQPEKVNVSEALRPLIEKICKEHGIEPQLTETGQISTEGDWLDTLAPFDPALAQFCKRAKLIKLKTSYFPNLEWPPGSGVAARVVHPKYDPLKKTGRLSARGNSKKDKDPKYPAIAIQQADPRIREVFLPRPGFVFSVADYSAIDLCCLAQTMKDLFGSSTHLDLINDGVDLHGYFGAVLAYNMDPEFKAEISGKTDRQGYDHFMAQKAVARPKPACSSCADGKHESWFDHWRTMAKPFGLGFPGGLGLETMVSVAAGYGISTTPQEAGHIRKLWYATHPDMRRYLKGWVEAQDGTYVSPLGMIRSGCSYTELANGRALQTPAAEGFKTGLWLVTRECYDASLGSVLLGSRPCVNMHDELVVEVREDGLEHERAERQSELMVAGMKTILKDVKVKAAPILTRRWTKKAKARRNEAGRLIPWEEA